MIPGMQPPGRMGIQIRIRARMPAMILMPAAIPGQMPGKSPARSISMIMATVPSVWNVIANTSLKNARIQLRKRGNVLRTTRMTSRAPFMIPGLCVLLSARMVEDTLRKRIELTRKSIITALLPAGAEEFIWLLTSLRIAGEPAGKSMLEIQADVRQNVRWESIVTPVSHNAIRKRVTAGWAPQ